MPNQVDCFGILALQCAIIIDNIDIDKKFVQLLRYNTCIGYEIRLLAYA